MAVPRSQPNLLKGNSSHTNASHFLPNQVVRLGYQREQSRRKGLLQRIVDKVTKHRLEANTMTMTNSKQESADEKIFLGLTQDTIFINIY